MDQPRTATSHLRNVALTALTVALASLAHGGELALIAGDIGDAGIMDGPAAAARLGSLAGVAVDAAGIVFVADGHAIRRISPDGAIATVAGRVGESGDRDGPGATARFNSPQGVAADTAGNLYVADRDNHTIRRISASGIVSTLAGSAGATGARDGQGPSARFFRPSGIAVDGSGNVFVSDTRNFTLRRISPAGVVITLAGRPDPQGSHSDASVDGPAGSARFGFPQGIAVDPKGTLYVADFFSHAIRRISVTGAVTTWAGRTAPPAMGSVDGLGAAARFANPNGVAIDKQGNLYVADTHSFTIRKITPTGAVSTLAGLADHSGYVDGAGSDARFSSLAALAVDGRGNVYVTDFASPPIPKSGKYAKPGPAGLIRRIDSQGIVSTFAGHVSDPSASPDGIGTAARFESPAGVVADPSGTLYVVDSAANTIRKITSSGLVTTLAGKTDVSGHQDGRALEALFTTPMEIARDQAGTLYVADAAASVVRRITRDGMVSTLAGQPNVRGSVDGVGAAARFSSPSAIAIDGAGNLLVTDGWANNIRKVTPSGEVTTWANESGLRGSTDGAAAQARFIVPTGIAVDRAGNVYVCDFGNRTIRKISPGRIVTTIAGRPNPSATRTPRSIDGAGARADFSGPIAIAVDDSGILYVADGTTIRRISGSGVVTTVAGVDGESGIRLGPLPGRLENTSGLALLDAHTLVATERFSVIKIRLDERQGRY